MTRHAAFVLLLASGIVLQLSRGVEVNIKDQEGKLCLYANLMLNFSVLYEVTGAKNATAELVLPSAVTTDGSKCDNTSSTLKLNFGDGHSWSVDFTMSGMTYQADSITFSYNLSDSSNFPDSTSNETASVTVKPQMASVAMDTCYSCKSKEEIQADLVKMTLTNVLLQAFVSNGSKSETVTSCAADEPTTSAPPTTPTTAATTSAPPTTPTTAATTAAPVTNSTTPAPPPTTTPTPTLPIPSTGEYKIMSDNGTYCLLAYFGLRFGIQQGDRYQEMNFEPNGTKVSGSCGVNSSELQLTSNAMTLTLTFMNDTAKFRLHALNFTTSTSSGVEFSAGNTNLTLWEAAVGSSYLCNKEQNYTITSLLSVYTFNLQVQLFEISKGKFSTAHECSLDDTSVLIPIIVGAALACLIVIVVIAYMIGRRKTYVGYQTL